MLSKRALRLKSPTTKIEASKIAVYRACVLSTLLSESWIAYKRQEHRLNSYHMRCLRRILDIYGRTMCPTRTFWSRPTCQACMNALLTQPRRCASHVYRMQHSRIPKDILYGELATGYRPAGRPMLRFRDVC